MPRRLFQANLMGFALLSFIILLVYNILLESRVHQRWCHLRSVFLTEHAGEVIGELQPPKTTTL